MALIYERNENDSRYCHVGTKPANWRLSGRLPTDEARRGRPLDSEMM